MRFENSVRFYWDKLGINYKLHFMSAVSTVGDVDSFNKFLTKFEEFLWRFDLFFCYFFLKVKFY